MTTATLTPTTIGTILEEDPPSLSLVLMLFVGVTEAVIGVVITVTYIIFHLHFIS